MHVFLKSPQNTHTRILAVRNYAIKPFQSTKENIQAKSTAEARRENS